MISSSSRLSTRVLRLFDKFLVLRAFDDDFSNLVEKDIKEFVKNVINSIAEFILGETLTEESIDNEDKVDEVNVAINGFLASESNKNSCIKDIYGKFYVRFRDIKYRMYSYYYHDFDKRIEALFSGFIDEELYKKMRDVINSKTDSGRDIYKNTVKTLNLIHQQNELSKFIIREVIGGMQNVFPALSMDEIVKGMGYEYNKALQEIPEGSNDYDAKLENKLSIGMKKLKLDFLGLRRSLKIKNTKESNNDLVKTFLEMCTDSGIKHHYPFFRSLMLSWTLGEAFEQLRSFSNYREIHGKIDGLCNEIKEYYKQAVSERNTKLNLALNLFVGRYTYLKMNILNQGLSLELFETIFEILITFDDDESSNGELSLFYENIRNEPETGHVMKLTREYTQFLENITHTSDLNNYDSYIQSSKIEAYVSLITSKIFHNIQLDKDGIREKIKQLSEIATSDMVWFEINFLRQYIMEVYTFKPNNQLVMRPDRERDSLKGKWNEILGIESIIRSFGIAKITEDIFSAFGKEIEQTSFNNNYEHFLLSIIPSQKNRFNEEKKKLVEMGVKPFDVDTISYRVFYTLQLIDETKSAKWKETALLFIGNLLLVFNEGEVFETSSTQATVHTENRNIYRAVDWIEFSVKNISGMLDNARKNLLIDGVSNLYINTEEGRKNDKKTWGRLAEQYINENVSENRKQKVKEILNAALEKM